LESKTSELETEVEEYPKNTPLDPRIKTRISKELDEIIDEIKELEKFSRVNFTGFMKVASVMTC
jgi:SPX domain protein involved in polyphosphate accumulation